MTRYSLTPAAKADLIEISDYIHERSPSAAAGVRSELRDAMNKLGKMPRMGHRRTDLSSEPLRFWSVYSFLIIYRENTSPLEIIRVLHAARDIRNILKEDIGG